MAFFRLADVSYELQGTVEVGSSVGNDDIVVNLGSDRSLLPLLVNVIVGNESLHISVGLNVTMLPADSKLQRTRSLPWLLGAEQSYTYDCALPTAPRHSRSYILDVVCISCTTRLNKTAITALSIARHLRWLSARQWSSRGDKADSRQYRLSASSDNAPLFLGAMIVPHLDFMPVGLTSPIDSNINLILH